VVKISLQLQTKYFFKNCNRPKKQISNIYGWKGKQKKGKMKFMATLN
jgi:hypothetical protein